MPSDTTRDTNGLRRLGVAAAGAAAAMADLAAALSTGGERCGRCGHDWHGMSCKASKFDRHGRWAYCGCATAFEEKESGT